MMAIFDGLTADTWAGAPMVPHKYMGPVPACMYTAGQLVDYTVHAWDIRQGAARPTHCDGDAADLLVPFCWILWQSTADTDGVEPFELGVRLRATTVADTKVGVSQEGTALGAWAPLDDVAWCSSSTRPASCSPRGSRQRGHGPAATASSPNDSATCSSGSRNRRQQVARRRSGSRRGRRRARSAQLLPHERGRDVADAGRGVEAAVGAGDDPPGIADRVGDAVEPVGDDLLGARRSCSSCRSRRRRAPCRRAAAPREAARTRARGGRSPSRSPARRRWPRRAAAGSSCERHVERVRSFVVAPADVEPHVGAGRCPSSAPLIASIDELDPREELVERTVGEQRVALHREVGRVDLQQQPLVDDERYSVRSAAATACTYSSRDA